MCVIVSNNEIAKSLIGLTFGGKSRFNYLPVYAMHKGATQVNSVENNRKEKIKTLIQQKVKQHTLPPTYYFLFVYRAVLLK